MAASAFLLTQRNQIAAALGTEGSFDSGSIAAANAKFILEGVPEVAYDIEVFERDPSRATIGGVASITGSKMGTLSFTLLLAGSGTAGVAPPWGIFLRACGFDPTVNSGSASIGTLVRDAKLSTGSVSPTVAGTYGGSKSGLLVLTVETVTTNTSVAIQATFYPGDGTTPTSGSFTQSGSGAVTLTGVASGVTFDFGDPSSSTAGIAVGDRFIIPLTSSSEAEVVYKPANVHGTGGSAGEIPCLDITLLTEKVRHSMHSARGTVSFEFVRGQPAKANFVFTGVYVTPADGALLTGVAYDETIPPPVLGANITAFGGSLPCWANLTIDVGNEIAMRECAAESEGYDGAFIVKRRVVGTVDPEKRLVATADNYGRLTADTLGSFAYTLGTTSGNIIEFESDNVQITAVEEGDRGGVRVQNLTLAFREPQYDSGADYSELVITVR